jgi:transcriptional regulator with XRE-family HTH domain
VDISVHTLRLDFSIKYVFRKFNVILENQGITKCLLTALGSNIRAERCVRGCSQNALAEKSGLHRTYIGVEEKGEKNATIFNCSKMTHAKQMKLFDLIRRAEDSFLLPTFVTTEQDNSCRYIIRSQFLREHSSYSSGGFAFMY